MLFTVHVSDTPLRFRRGLAPWKVQGRTVAVRCDQEDAQAGATVSKFEGHGIEIDSTG